MSDERIERAHEAIARLLDSLTDNWQSIQTDRLCSADQMAVLVCTWTGLVECRLNVTAWTDAASVHAECVVCGVWVDGQHASILPEKLRSAIPAWHGKHVAVQPDAAIEARLTQDGLEAQRDLHASPLDRFAALAAATCNLQPGRARIRILGEGAGVPGAQPRVTADSLNVILKSGLGEIAHAIRERDEQRPCSDPGAPAAAPAPAPTRNQPEPDRKVDDGDPVFPPMQYVERDGRVYDFGGRRLLWEVFRALHQARRRLEPAELAERVPRWADTEPSTDTIKQALNELRTFWRSQKRPDLADRIKNQAGVIWLEKATETPSS